MTEYDAIQLAMEALQRQGTSVGKALPKAIRKDRHMRKGKNLSGWLVVVPLDVPQSFEPNTIDVEVYDPDGEVHIPTLI